MGRWGEEVGALWPGVPGSRPGLPLCPALPRPQASPSVPQRGTPRFPSLRSLPFPWVFALTYLSFQSQVKSWLGLRSLCCSCYTLRIIFYYVSKSSPVFFPTARGIQLLSFSNWHYQAIREWAAPVYQLESCSYCYTLPPLCGNWDNLHKLMCAGAENPSGMWRRQDTSWLLLPLFFLGDGDGKGL